MHTRALPLTPSRTCKTTLHTLKTSSGRDGLLGVQNLFCIRLYHSLHKFLKTILMNFTPTKTTMLQGHWPHLRSCKSPSEHSNDKHFRLLEFTNKVLIHRTLSCSGKSRRHFLKMPEPTDITLPSRSSQRIVAKMMVHYECGVEKSVWPW